MREILEVARLAVRAAALGRRGMVATIVCVEGSHYRRPGARLLLVEGGEAAGSVSAGCLEADLRERLASVWRSGTQTVDYDLSSPEDRIWGFGMGCDGKVTLLLEPMTRALVRELAGLARRSGSGEGTALATVVRAEPAAGCSAGDRVFAPALFEETGRGALAKALASDLMRARERRAGGALVRRSLGTGKIEVFVEYLPPATSLLLCGAGPDVLPLVRQATALSWSVLAAAPRFSKASREALEAAGVARFLDAGEAARRPVDAAVLMSHRFEEDADALERFAAAPPRYLGLLGSRERADGLFEELKRRRGSVPAGLLQSLHAPAGLDIGAQGPEEIALAIVSEVRAVLAGRTGGFLRDRRGPIHERENGNGFDCDRGLERVLDDPDVRRTAVHARVDDPLPVR